MILRHRSHDEIVKSMRNRLKSKGAKSIKTNLEGNKEFVIQTLYVCACVCVRACVFFSILKFNDLIEKGEAKKVLICLIHKRKLFVLRELVFCFGSMDIKRTQILSVVSTLHSHMCSLTNVLMINIYIII